MMLPFGLQQIDVGTKAMTLSNQRIELEDVASHIDAKLDC